MRIGLGTAAIGRPQYINIRTQKVEQFELGEFKTQGIQVLDSAYDLGVRYFDTAPGYGLAEDLLIEWLNSHDKAGVEVATKWGYEYVANFNPSATIHEVKEHSLKMLNKQWERSQALLPFLSSLQIHSATLETGVLENEAVLDRLHELKQVHGLKIGLTTTGENQLEVFKKGFDITFEGKPLFEVFQCTYNILDQSMLEAAVACKNDGRRFVVKEALANGRVFRNTEYNNYIPLYSDLETISTKHAVGVDAIALQFCIQELNPFMVLSGASSAEQLSDNLKVSQLELSEEDLSILRKHKVEPKSYWDERKRLGWN